MQEDKSRADSLTPAKEDAERDATSKETVSDLDKSGAGGEGAGSGTSDSRSKGQTSSPSPDGQFDAPPGGVGPGDEAGPM